MKVAAVRYLNMLPYFFDDPEIALYDHPSELNAAALNGDVQMGCISAIAGLQLHWQCIGLGISARKKIRSVYLEPRIYTQADQNFWHAFSEGRKVSAKVTIFTSGASAQSQWLFSQLLRHAGAAVEINKTAHGIRTQHDQIFANKDHEALLCIGDIALQRNEFFPETLRLDLAQLWWKFEMLPCIFAGWFVEKENPEVRRWKARLANNFARWHQLNHDQQLSYVRKYSFPETGFYEYLKAIDGVFQEPHWQTLKRYQQLQVLDSTQTNQQGVRQVAACSNSIPS